MQGMRLWRNPPVRMLGMLGWLRSLILFDVSGWISIFRGCFKLRAFEIPFSKKESIMSTCAALTCSSSTRNGLWCPPPPNPASLWFPSAFAALNKHSNHLLSTIPRLEKHPKISQSPETRILSCQILLHPATRISRWIICQHLSASRHHWNAQRCCDSRKQHKEPGFPAPDRLDFRNCKEQTTWGDLGKKTWLKRSDLSNFPQFLKLEPHPSI